MVNGRHRLHEIGQVISYVVEVVLDPEKVAVLPGGRRQFPWESRGEFPSRGR